MAPPATVHCKHCDRHIDECGELSSRRRCAACAMQRLVDSDIQIHRHNGPWFTHWRRRIAASVGATLPE